MLFEIKNFNDLRDQFEVLRTSEKWKKIPREEIANIQDIIYGFERERAIFHVLGVFGIVTSLVAVYKVIERMIEIIGLM